MAIKFEKIQPGMTLWSRGTYRNGMNRPVKGEWTVHVISVDAEMRTAKVAYNGRTQTMDERRLTRLYTKRMARKETSEDKADRLSMEMEQDYLAQQEKETP